MAATETPDGHSFRVLPPEQPQEPARSTVKFPAPGKELTLVAEGAAQWPWAQVGPLARTWLEMDAPGYLVSGQMPPGQESESTRRDVIQALSLLTGRMCLPGALVHADGAGTVRITRPDGYMLWLRPVGSPAVEAREGGIPAVAHRIVNTGEYIEHTAQDGGTYGVHAFECGRCHKRAVLADFEYGRAGKCTDQAEADHAHKRAQSLLDDVTFKDATAYAFTSPNQHGQPVTDVFDRPTARTTLAFWLRCGAPHTWGNGELRVRCFQTDHTVRPVAGEPTAKERT